MIIQIDAMDFERLHCMLRSRAPHAKWQISASDGTDRSVTGMENEWRKRNLYLQVNKLLLPLSLFIFHFFGKP